MELCERIALARKGAGLSQEQLGEKLGVSRQAVSKWESGQTNPDVAYIAEMCRLFGVSSDWLLLGEENAQEAPPARCPGCQTVVTGLDNFCPNCGRSLKGQSSPTYTLLLKGGEYIYQSPEDLCSLSGNALFPEDSPLAKPIDRERAFQLSKEAPCILARGLTLTQARELREKIKIIDCYSSNFFLFYRDSDGDKPEELVGKEPISEETLTTPKEPMSFGMMVLAVILGVVGAILLLSFL